MAGGPRPFAARAAAVLDIWLLLALPFTGRGLISLDGVTTAAAEALPPSSY
jgi:hypothetical protein